MDDVAVQRLLRVALGRHSPVLAAGEQCSHDRQHLVGCRREIWVARGEVVMFAAFGLVVHGDEDAQRAIWAALGHVHGCLLPRRGVLAALPLLVVQAPPIGERHVARGQGARGHRFSPLLRSGDMQGAPPFPIAYDANE